MTEREDLQESEYEFPYHYLPHVEDGAASNLRFLRWGPEYACYMHHIADLVSQMMPDSHLDVGCGDARLFHLTAAPGRRRVGVDFSPRTLHYARAFNPDAEFTTDMADLGEERFAFLSAVEVLEHVPDDEVRPFLRSLRQHLAPGAHLLISVPSTAQALTPKHYRHYDEDLLRDQVQDAAPELECLHVEHIYRASRLVDAVMRWTMNRWWVIEVAPLRRWLWNHVWSRRQAPPGLGRHVVGLFRAPQ